MSKFPNILFVTGTDTGIGKTYVTSALLRSFSETAFSVSVLKPIETGCEIGPDGELVGADIESLYAACSKQQTKASVNLYRFRAPLAPAVACLQEARTIDLDSLKSSIRNLAESSDLLIVEGAGGLLVPIFESYTFADLAADCEMKILLVIGSKLGAINHASLSFEVLRSRDLEVLGYVLNECYPPTQQELAVETNRSAIRVAAIRYGISERGILAYQPPESPEPLSTIAHIRAAVIESFKLSL